MQAVVVEPTQQGEVGELVVAAVKSVPDVVHLEEGTPPAVGHLTTVIVAMFDLAS